MYNMCNIYKICKSTCVYIHVYIHVYYMYMYLHIYIMYMYARCTCIKTYALPPPQRRHSASARLSTPPANPATPTKSPNPAIPAAVARATTFIFANPHELAHAHSARAHVPQRRHSASVRSIRQVVRRVCIRRYIRRYTACMYTALYTAIYGVIYGHIWRIYAPA